MSNGFNAQAPQVVVWPLGNNGIQMKKAEN